MGVLGEEACGGDEYRGYALLVLAGERDARVGFGGSAYFEVTAFQDAGFAGCHGYAVATGGCIGVLGVLCTDHGEELRAGLGFVYLQVQLGFIEALAHEVAHGVADAEFQLRAVGGGVEFAVQQGAADGGVMVAQRGGDAEAVGEVPCTEFQDFAGEHFRFALVLVAVRGGYFLGEVGQGEGALRLYGEVEVVLNVFRKQVFTCFEYELGSL